MPRQPHSNRVGRHKAFSLIELLLVIVLLGVVAAASVPNFSNTYRRMQLKEKAENIEYLMNYGQSRAIIKNVSFRLQWSEDFRRCWLTEERAEEKDFHRVSGRWGRGIDLPPGIRAVSSLPHFEFYPDGTIDKGTISVCDNKNCYTVSTQEKRGRVRMFPSDIKEVSEEMEK